MNHKAFDISLTFVPTWWDEAKVQEARMGEWRVTARRKGTTWYVGGMSANLSATQVMPWLWFRDRS